MRRRAAAALGLVPGLLGGCVAPHDAAPPTAPAALPAEPAPRPAGPPGFVLAGALSQGGMVVGTAPAGTGALTLDGAAVPVAPDGRFLIAFGRDHGPAATLVAARTGLPPVARTLAIAPRAWKIERLPIPKHRQPDAAFLALRRPELAQIGAARAAAATVRSDGWEQRFVWPAKGRVTGAFGAQRVYDGEAGSYHSGEDVAVPTGTPVVAPADGVVLLAAAGTPFTLEGHLLMIGHGMGLDSAFLHLSRIDVAVGQRVRQGQVLGLSGATGRATGPHLHWALTWRGERIDPKLVAGTPG